MGPFRDAPCGEVIEVIDGRKVYGDREWVPTDTDRLSDAPWLLLVSRFFIMITSARHRKDESRHATMNPMEGRSTRVCSRASR